MKSKVYFIRVNDSDTAQVIKEKLGWLIRESNIFSFIKQADTVAVKMHFGEEANTGFVRPEYVRIAVDDIVARGARPLLTDTNTLYRGRRMTSEEHAQLAYEHGFTQDIVGAPLLISDDTGKEEYPVRINEKFIKTAKIATLFSSVDTIVGIAHFKGHMMTGFGGALKNLGMGCATRKGKLAQHSDISPYVITNTCTGCGECVKVCPAEAIIIVNKKAVLDSKKCIGCASCIAACKFNSMDVDWEAGGYVIQEKMAEYAKAVLKGKEEKCAFINFAIKITKECDCLAKDDPKISPDVGIFASQDPVSIDKAAFDLVIQACGKDIFKELHPKRDGFRQLQHAHEIGIGNLDYELDNVKYLSHFDIAM